MCLAKTTGLLHTLWLLHNLQHIWPRLVCFVRKSCCYRSFFIWYSNVFCFCYTTIFCNIISKRSIIIYMLCIIKVNTNNCSNTTTNKHTFQFGICCAEYTFSSFTVSTIYVSNTCIFCIACRYYALSLFTVLFSYGDSHHV